MNIRPARPEDYPSICALWNPVIRDTTTIFHSEERDSAKVHEIVEARRRDGHEFFVAVAEGRLLGFATYAQFRGGNGYRHALEHSIILDPAAWGRGVGRALMTRLEGHARDGGGHTLYAGVSGENAAGIAFHEKLGFKTIATLPEAGRKFDRWLDLVLMMKFL